MFAIRKNDLKIAYFKKKIILYWNKTNFIIFMDNSNYFYEKKKLKCIKLCKKKFCHILKF